MGRPSAFRESQQRVGRICAPPTESRLLRRRLLDEIVSVVPFDYYAWVLTDPETEVGSSPLAEIPDLTRLPELVRLKYLTTHNRWTHLDGAVALLARHNGSGLSASLLWRQLLSQYGVVDVASVVFRDEFGCWGFLDLWRTTSSPFSADEAAYLADLAAPITMALRRSQAATFTPRTDNSDAHRGPVVLLLSATLQLLAQTRETDEYLRLLLPPELTHSPVPASAYNVGGQLLAVESNVDEHHASARVHLSGGRWLTLRAARVMDASSAPNRDIAVTIEDSAPAERTAVFCRAHGLTPRERELLEHLVTGLATQEIASRLFLSPHTVQDHLKSIFTKTSVRSRPALVSRALGS